MRLARTLALTVVLVTGLSYLLAGGGGGPGRTPATSDRTGASATAGHRRRTGSARPAGTSATTGPTTTTTTSPGQLPQTSAFPPANDPQFLSEMADLWRGVVTGRVAPAMPAFFPEAAYLQLKTISDAQGDWQDRLVYDFGLDLAAAHQLLGADPGSATLVSVNVPSGYGHWVPPGVCYNSIGYFEVPNARVVYRLGGTIQSFGIASMISWRGEWYVVHLGAVLRNSDTGVVDDPATGPGTSAYSSTC